MKIENIPAGKIHPYEKNAKKHPEKQIEWIANSIREFGFRQPLVIDKNNVLVIGHGRLLAAKKLGIDTVPCVRADDLTDEQIKALRLADNKTNESEWDFELLDSELEGIFDLDMTDFGFEIEKDEVIEDDYTPELPEEPVAKLGQIYQLGRHRLMCGDSTNIEDVDALLEKDLVDMVLTDPPYNVNYEGSAGKIKNDNLNNTEFREFLTKAFTCVKKALKNGGAFHIWYADSEGYNFRGACMDAGLNVRQQLIWVKNHATLGRQDFQHQYESVLAGENIDLEEYDSDFAPSLYGWKEGAKHEWYKKRKEKDVMFFDKPVASKEHPTMKPILLFDYEMKCNTKPGDKVLDLFGGSGTTIMAAEQNNRQAYVMEFDPKFVDVIIDRWEKFTGEKAVLISDTPPQSAEVILLMLVLLTIEKRQKLEGEKVL